MNASGGGTVVARCPPDHPYVLGGGAVTLAVGTALAASAPLQSVGTENPGAGGWQASATSDGVAVFAICAR